MKTMFRARCKGVLLLVACLFYCLVTMSEVIRYPGNTNNRHSAAKASEWRASEWPFSEVAKEAEKLPWHKSDKAILNMAYDGSGNADGKVTFYSEDGKAMNPHDVLSFSGWGRDLLSVTSVVVEIKDSDNADEMVKHGFKEALKLREYKNSLLSNPEGKWFIEGSENIRFYVVEQYSYAKSDIYAVDVKQFFGYPPKTPLVMKEISGRKSQPRDRKELSADAVDTCLRDIWNDKDFAEKIKKAYDAANDYDNPDPFGKPFERKTGGGMPSSAASSGNGKQSALASLDVNDDTYDWCKCEKPQGCFETDMMVSFQCLRCKKYNREYARKALELERRLKEKGVEVKWFGDGAESKAHQAAGEK